MAIISGITDVDFGQISAEAERVTNPKLISDGFVDIMSIEKEAIDGPRFLFLGYKGSGKSSIAERLDLKLGGNHSSFVTKISLADFPFTPFSKIIKGDVEPEAKFPTAWSWVLLIYVLESLEKDHSLHHPNIDTFKDAIKVFRELGISPGSSPSSIVRTSSQKGFSAKLPYDIINIQHTGGTVKPTDEIYNFVDAIKTVASQARTAAKHFLVIDGLDEILSSRGIQYKSLYALIYEVSQLNELFSKSGLGFKILVLCRTDLFDRTPGPNKNKVRQAYAVEIDWYHDPNDPQNSLLVRAANLRASLSLGRKCDVFNEFFPREIHRYPAMQYLLDMTRHTPRDFLQLLTYIKRFAKNGKLSDDGIKSGLREYSIKYFYPEIHDELSGYATEAEITAVIEALGRIGRRDFSYQELLTDILAESRRIEDDRLLEICRVLFDCSAIGNIDYVGGNTFYSFKYRNRLASFTKSKKIGIHRGLWKALNV